MPKKLQKQSIYAEYDQDGDGIITDEELGSIKQIKQTEDASRKNLAQLRMARFSLIAMGVFTVAMFFIPIERVNALADISNLFYITGGGIVATYMGTTAWTQRSANGK
tara:strand:+ start:478 stop:801 length:324 start_codon:yes stop_codon:yes gene_type:complete